MSLSLLDHIKTSATPHLVGLLASKLGETSGNTDKAIGAAVPAILAGIATTARMPSGLSAISKLVSNPANDGELIHQLPALYQGALASSPIAHIGTQLLQAIFGNKINDITHSIAAVSGIRPASAAALVKTLTPHVLAALGEHQRASGDMSPAGLAQLIESEQASIARSLSPALSKVLGSAGNVAGTATAAAGAAAAAATGTRTSAPARASTNYEAGTYEAGSAKSRLKAALTGRGGHSTGWFGGWGRMVMLAGSFLSATA